MHNITVLVNHRKKSSRANHLNPPINRVGMVFTVLIIILTMITKLVNTMSVVGTYSDYQ